MKLKYTFIPFSLAALILVVLRAIQGFSGTTFEFGQGKEAAFCIVAFIGSALVILMSMLSKNSQNNFKINKNIFLGFVGLFSGASIIFYSLDRINTYLTVNHTGILIFLGLTGLLSGVIFMIMGISSIIGRNVFENFKILTLIPTLWALVRLFSIFFEYSSTTVSIWNAADEFFCICFLLFLFNHARTFADVEYKGTDNKLVASGMCMILFAIIYNSRVILEQITSTGSFNIWSFPNVLMDILFSLYAILYIINLKNSRYIKVVETNFTENSEEKSEVEGIKSNYNDIVGGTDENEHIPASKNTDLSDVNQLIDELKSEK